MTDVIARFRILSELSTGQQFDRIRRMSLDMRTTLPLLVGLLVGHFFIGLIVVEQPSPTTITENLPALDKSKAKDAKKLFRRSCVKCHGADGAGETTSGQIVGAADFTDAEWQQRVDDERLENSISYGRGQMPAFGKKLTPQQISALVAYVRALKRE